MKLPSNCLPMPPTTDKEVNYLDLRELFPLIRSIAIPASNMLLGEGRGFEIAHAPLEKLVRTLNEVPGKLVRTMAAYRDSRQPELA